VRLLLEKGAKTSAADSAGVTPLHFAAMEGHEAVARLLLGKGAEVSCKTKNGGTVLHLAAKNGHEEVVRMLLGAGADVSVVDNFGATPLHLGAHFEGVARLLLEHGANVSAKTLQGMTPEDFATMRSHPGVTAMLRAEAARRVDPKARGHQEPPPPKPQVAYTQNAPCEFLLEVEMDASYRNGEKLQVQVQIP